MKTTAVRLYGKEDLRLETFDLPEITESEILAKVISDSVCMSSFKAAEQGASHKRVPNDIAENPKNLKFKTDIEAPMLTQVYNNDEGDAVLINSNYAIEADLVPAEDAIALESADNNPYVNIIAVRSEDKDKEEIKTLVEVLHSKDIQDFINESYKGSVIPSNK